MSRHRAPAPGQLALFGSTGNPDSPIPAPAAPSTPPDLACLFHSTARGLDARSAELRAWREREEAAGTRLILHAWSIAPCVPTGRTDTCQPTVLSADVRKRDRWCSDAPEPACGCTLEHDELLYRGACRKQVCTWEGPPRPSEALAAEDACDHAHPGWRDFPPVPPVPMDSKQHPAWLKKVAGVYPPGWLENGGPIRTLRKPPGTRPVGDRTPFGGYDIAAPGE